MAKKILVPVFPSERFYDAVVRAADIVGDEGGLITFAFTRIRPPPEAYAADPDGSPTELDVSPDANDYDAKDFEVWREAQISGLDEARQLLYERGITDRRIDYLFADEADAEGAAQAIADEAAAGAYDIVMLSRGYFEDEVTEDGATPGEVAEAVHSLEEESVKLVVA